jgi:hypothetical protein
MSPQNVCDLKILRARKASNDDFPVTVSGSKSVTKTAAALNDPKIIVAKGRREYAKRLESVGR